MQDEDLDTDDEVLAAGVHQTIEDLNDLREKVCSRNKYLQSL